MGPTVALIGEVLGLGTIIQVQGAGVDWADGTEVEGARVRGHGKSGIAGNGLGRKAVSHLGNRDLSRLGRLGLGRETAAGRWTS